MPNPIAFQIDVSALGSDWPESCAGVKHVLDALAKMLEAAAAGNEEAFTQAEGDLSYAAQLWHADTFGTPDAPSMIEGDGDEDRICSDCGGLGGTLYPCGNCGQLEKGATEGAW